MSSLSHEHLALDMICTMYTLYRQNSTVEPLSSGPLLSDQPLLGGQRLKSWKNCQLHIVIKMSIQWPPLLSGHGQLLAIPRVKMCSKWPVVSSPWRHSALMVSALAPASSGPGSSPGWGHCVVFLGKTKNSHSASLHLEVFKWVLANKFYCWGNLTNCGEVTCDGLASHPGGVEILLATSCYRNWDKLQQL